jgi:hypothetical protein
VDPSAASLNASLDAAADEVCERLAQEFDLERPERLLLPGQVTLGLEVEVPFSSYFPELWSSWGLHARRVADLTPAELAAFSSECFELEGPLRRKLNATVECGVPRGNDRYYEFSLDPSADAGLQWEQVELLTAAGVLPRDRGHALHCTLGGVRRTSDVYYLALALELMFVQPQRISAGVAATRKTIHAGWGRKGLSGVFEKGPGELKARAPFAVELRTLQLPKCGEQLGLMMRMLRGGADALAEKQAGMASERTEWLAEFRGQAEAAFKACGLPATNWWKGGPDGGVQYDVWELFVRELPALKQKLMPLCILGALMMPSGFDAFSEAASGGLSLPRTPQLLM